MFQNIDWANLQNPHLFINGDCMEYMKTLPDKAVFHINDTHPGLAIAEMMRILMDGKGLGWDEAQAVTNRCMAYTNHTIMSEALERWPEDLVRRQHYVNARRAH